MIVPNAENALWAEKLGPAREGKMKEYLRKAHGHLHLFQPHSDMYALFFSSTK